MADSAPAGHVAPRCVAARLLTRAAWTPGRRLPDVSAPGPFVAVAGYRLADRDDQPSDCVGS
ncbi:hypothetical protein GCM10010293_61560 [Streptomyces griseoflavus]|nr:hypothetical protein GCM10010293_61560 [Streptomyces griseoflavus]